MTHLIDLAIYDKETKLGIQQIQLRLEIPDGCSYSIQLVPYEEMRKAWTNQEKKFNIGFI